MTALLAERNRHCWTSASRISRSCETNSPQRRIRSSIDTPDAKHLQCIIDLDTDVLMESYLDMSTYSAQSGHYTNEAQRAAHFVAIILSEIKRKHVQDDATFDEIVNNNVVIPELVKNYGYLHMFGY